MLTSVGIFFNKELKMTVLYAVIRSTKGNT